MGPEVSTEGLSRTRKALAKAHKRDSMQVLKKLTTVVDGRREIISNPPLVVPIGELADSMTSEQIVDGMKSLLTQYRRTLTADRRHLLHQFTLTDVARKVVGVGSVGTRAWILLLEADGGLGAAVPAGQGGAAARCLPTTAAPASTATRASAWSPGST